MFDLSLSAVVLLVHIAAGILLVAHSLFAPHLARARREAPTVEALRQWLDFGRRTAAANPPVALVLLATGIYLGSAGWWSQGWFAVAAASWLVNTVLAIAVLQRAAGTLEAAAARAQTGPVTPELDAMRRSRAWHLAERVMLASDLGILYAMFVKPSAAETLLVIAAAFAVGVAWQAASGRRRAPGAPAATAA